METKFFFGFVTNCARGLRDLMIQVQCGALYFSIIQRCILLPLYALLVILSRNFSGRLSGPSSSSSKLQQAATLLRKDLTRSKVDPKT